MMKAALLVFVSVSAFADPTFKSISYIDRGGDRFRYENARQWPKCKPTNSARKIFLDRTNELREVAYWDGHGKIHEAGKDNNPEVHKKVDEIFARAQIESTNPCLSPESPGKSSNAALQ